MSALLGGAPHPKNDLTKLSQSSPKISQKLSQKLSQSTPRAPPGAPPARASSPKAPPPGRCGPGGGALGLLARAATVHSCFLHFFGGNPPTAPAQTQPRTPRVLGQGSSFGGCSQGPDPNAAAAIRGPLRRTHSTCNIDTLRDSNSGRSNWKQANIVLQFAFFTWHALDKVVHSVVEHLRMRPEVTERTQ